MIHSMENTLWARCVAIKDEEHAVSVLMQGPEKPNVYDNRPTMKLNPEPTIACGESFW